MAEAVKPKEIGLKRGRMLANLSQPEQLAIIAEGLPIIMKSAGDLLSASKELDEYHRCAHILKDHAMEEAAKILILLDIVRCPPKLRSKRIGPMMGWFYKHDARLIYTEAQSWKPENIKQLQEYVDHSRKPHGLVGANCEHIAPNLPSFSRELMLYADMFTGEDGDLIWHEPHALPYLGHYPPRPWRICEALQNSGAFTRKGLDIVSIVWSKQEFTNIEHSDDAKKLTEEMLRKLERAKLTTESYRKEEISLLSDTWQLPMYHIDFKEIEEPLADLQRVRDAITRPEVYN